MTDVRHQNYSLHLTTWYFSFLTAEVLISIQSTEFGKKILFWWNFLNCHSYIGLSHPLVEEIRTTEAEINEPLIFTYYFRC